MIDAADGAARKQKAGETAGITSDKLDAAGAAIAATLIVTKVARAYAFNTGNHELHKAVSYSKGVLENTPLDELEARLQTMLDAAAQVVDALGDYGLQYGPAKVAAAAAAIQDYTRAAPGTRVAIAGRSAVTGSVPGIMQEGKKALLVMDDLVHLYDEDHAEFVTTYKAARNVVDAGGRHDAPGAGNAAA